MLRSMDGSDVEFIEEIDDSETNVTASQISEAVLYTTDWTTETILTQYKRENINLNPNYQRRDAWKIPRKSRFVESILLGLPIPQIILAEIKGERGKYLVLDGKQRLLTLLQFTDIVETKNSGFKLKDLEVRKDLNGKSFEDLTTDILLKDDVNQFYNQPIRTVVIRNWPNIDFLNLVFIRLNTGSVQLSPQELRQALIPGEFMNYLDKAASESNALRTLLKIDEPDFRMRDVELLLRYLSFSFFIDKYSGNLRQFMDQTAKSLSKNWPENETIIKNKIDNYEKAIEAAIEIFGKDEIGRTWKGDGFQPRVNKAIIDAMTIYFSDEVIRNAALERPLDVKEGFKDLCVSSEEFRDSIEKTTKSLGAVSTRLFLWGSRLKDILELEFDIPYLEDGRIIFKSFR